MTFTDLDLRICDVNLREPLVNPDCTVYATDTHHMKSKRRLGSDDPINKRYVCRSCHDCITQHRGEWTMKYRTFEWQREGVTEWDFYQEYPEYYDQCCEAEFGYSKSKQLGRTE